MGTREKALQNRFNTFLGILIVIEIFILFLKILVWTGGISTTNFFWAALPDFLPFLVLGIVVYLKKIQRELSLSKIYDVIFGLASIFAVGSFFL